MYVVMYLYTEADRGHSILPFYTNVSVSCFGSAVSFIASKCALQQLCVKPISCQLFILISRANLVLPRGTNPDNVLYHASRGYQADSAAAVKYLRTMDAETRALC